MKVTTTIKIKIKDTTLELTLNEARELYNKLKHLSQEPNPIPWTPAPLPIEPWIPDPWTAPNTGTPYPWTIYGEDLTG